MNRHECDGCGLAACDLPDGIDPDDVFDDGHCQGCAQLVAAGQPTPYEMAASW
ncbi:hypothetical protein [Kribbella sp. CA-293567]|uniref:hypothetical protein n=1 Tax=Kribbella sp. CA-293567 TaxID=3002436 RepID=UPI0022DDA0C0|nr:hypothetical protein [Kribbella sp. CA-293567]WBQ03003.1 hypothetical protein OX958_23835 [Kribbella sp. CA-293567]